MVSADICLPGICQAGLRVARQLRADRFELRLLLVVQLSVEVVERHRHRLDGVVTLTGFMLSR